MPAELSISYLKPVSLLTVIRNENALDLSRPLQRYFPNTGHGTEEIELPIRQRRPNALPHTSRDGEPYAINRGNLVVRKYGPSWLKPKVEWSNKDVHTFQAADKARQIEDRDVGGKVAIDRAVDLARDAAVDIGVDIRTEKERLCAQALGTGLITTKLPDGTPGGSINYGLSSITTAPTAWTNSGADIIGMLYGAREQFSSQNPGGLPPTVAFYRPSLYRRAFANNTAWKEWKKANPDLAKGVLQLAGGQNEVNADGYYVTRMFDMLWVAVDGKYVDLNGTSQYFWDENQITLARPESMGAQWAMTYGHEYNPEPEINFETFASDRAGVKTGTTVGYFNGLPLLKQPEYVQPWTVIY